MLLFFLPRRSRSSSASSSSWSGWPWCTCFIIAGIGLVGIAVGATRYVRSRRANGFQR